MYIWINDLTLFEALTGGAFDRLNWQHDGEFDQNVSQKSNAPVFTQGGDGRFWKWPVHYKKKPLNGRNRYTTLDLSQ